MRGSIYGHNIRVCKQTFSAAFIREFRALDKCAWECVSDRELDARIARLRNVCDGFYGYLRTDHHTFWLSLQDAGEIRYALRRDIW